MKFNSISLHTRLIRHLREWHRKLGIIAAFFIIFLSLSGVALNHTTALSLDHQPITDKWLLDHYGIAPPSDVRFYQNNTLKITNQLIWFKKKLLMESTTDIVATALISSSLNADEMLILVLSTNQITLFNQQGELIDQLGEASGVPANIKALHINQNTIVVNTDTGYFQTDIDFLQWRKIATITQPKWILATEGSIQERAIAEVAYRSQFLTLERIILDAHSGRILGLFGVILMDIVAILLILLSLSGIYIWLRYARSKR